MDPIIKTFDKSALTLVQANTYEEVIKACRDIDNISLDYFKEHYERDSSYTLSTAGKRLTRLLVEQFQNSKDLSFQLKVLKTILRPALCLSYMDVEFMLNRQSSVRALCFLCYTWLKNYEFTQKFGVFLPSCNDESELKVFEALEKTNSPYSEHSKYFAIAIENLIMYYETHENFPNRYDCFAILFNNMENSHQNVHKLLLELYKLMLIRYDKNLLMGPEQQDVESGLTEDRKMITDVIDMPWTNRNKFHLLAVLVSSKCHLLRSHSKFNFDNFMNGIQVGLTIHHLLAPSQALVKAIKNHEAFKGKLKEIVAKLLWEGDDQLVQNLIKYWLSTFDPKFVEEIYRTMSQAYSFYPNIPTTNAKFYRVLVLRNAFKKVFNRHELDARVMDFAFEIEDVPTKIEVFQILMDNVHSETKYEQRLRNILTALKFLTTNMCIENSSFIDQHVMRRLPDFFNLLASMKLRNVQVLKEIFGIIVTDIYLHGIALGTYESLSFSLKLLNIVLKQYFDDSGNRLSKNTNIEGNLSFGVYLKENKIWDVRSNSVFSHLINLLEADEHSDISEMAAKMIVDHFITKKLTAKFTVDGIKFHVWISQKSKDEFSRKDISSAASRNHYFVLDFEEGAQASQNARKTMLSDTQFLLESHFEEFEDDPDPVQLMEEGWHLFRLVDCVNYGIKRSNELDVGRINKILWSITQHFLNYVSDPKVPPTFELLDEKLRGLLKRSSIQDSNFAEMKQKLTLFVWFTLRSLSELSETVAKVSNATKTGKERFETIENCIAVNIAILTRCCHKGVIDSASQAIGAITKIVSSEYTKFCKKTTPTARSWYRMLVILKLEIDSGRRPSSGDIRSSRGLIVMAHNIIANHPPFLRFPMEWFIFLPELNTFDDAETVQFASNIKPIQLHQLAFLIRDGDLAEEMMKYYNHILLATLKAYKESTDFVVINALLQIIGAVVPKIANQKRHLIMNDEAAAMHYEPKSVSAYDFVSKFPFVFTTGLNDLANTDGLPTTYIIVLLEIFSNFENRNIFNCPQMDPLPEVFKNLMSHGCEKIRILAAKCYAQWLEVGTDMRVIIKKDILQVFSSDGNIVHSTAHCVRLMIQRYESSVKFVRNFDLADFKSTLREKMLKSFEKVRFEGTFKGARNFYIRYHLMDFLIFLGFSFDEYIVQSLMNDGELKSHIGYKMFAQKVKELSTK